MSIAIDPIFNGYYPADSDHADPIAVTQESRAGSRTAVDSRASDRRTSDRIETSAFQFIYTLSTLLVSGALLGVAGWLCLEVLESLQTQIEFLNTRQLLRALAGA